MNKKVIRKDLKKSIKSFIKDEDGFVDKSKILRIGLSTVAVLGVLGELSKAHADLTIQACGFAAHTSAWAHNNQLECTNTPDGCKRCVPVNWPSTDHAVGHARHFSHDSRNGSLDQWAWLDEKSRWIRINTVDCPTPEVHSNTF